MADVIANRERETPADEADHLPSPRRRARRRWPLWLALGLAVGVAAGALLGGWRSGPDATALVLVREVPPGHELLAEDVRQVTVAGLDGVDAPAKAAAIVGRTMAVPAPPGSVLTVQMIGDAVFPENGTALVGVTVADGAYPPGLAAGARVQVVATHGTTLGSNSEPVSARVLSVRPSASGAVLVALKLAQWDAAAVATAGAQHRICLVGLPRI